MDLGNKRHTLICEIRSLAFTVNDLALYLDTHPFDSNALKFHNEYSRKLNELKAIYQKEYGPLTICDSENTWEWIETPWPWEKGGN